MLRKISSLTSFLSFIITLLTSVILYIVPHGRTAYWADWHFWGLSKDQWGEIHITVGTLFLIASFVHIWLNWKPIMAYMKNQARELVVMTRPMIISLLLTVFVTVGTLLGWPPMQQLLDFGSHIKEVAIETYGNPPYGHAELSPLKKFCGFLGFNVDDALAVLKAKGYGPSITVRTTVKDIARSKGVSPQHVYDDIRIGLGGDPFETMPPTPPEGTGKMKLSDLAASYGLPVDQIIAKLADLDIKATPDMTLKEVGVIGNMSPHEIYTALRNK